MYELEPVTTLYLTVRDDNRMQSNHARKNGERSQGRIPVDVPSRIHTAEVTGSIPVAPTTQPETGLALGRSRFSLRESRMLGRRPVENLTRKPTLWPSQPPASRRSVHRTSARTEVDVMQRAWHPERVLFGGRFDREVGGRAWRVMYGG